MKFIGSLIYDRLFLTLKCHSWWGLTYYNLIFGVKSFSIMKNNNYRIFIIITAILSFFNFCSTDYNNVTKTLLHKISVGIIFFLKIDYLLISSNNQISIVIWMFWKYVTALNSLLWKLNLWNFLNSWDFLKL